MPLKVALIIALGLTIGILADSATAQQSASVSGTASVKVLGSPTTVRKYTDFVSFGKPVKVYVPNQELGDFVVSSSAQTSRVMLSQAGEMPASFGVHTEGNYCFSVSVSSKATATSVDGTTQTIVIGDLKDILPLHSRTHNGKNDPATGDEEYQFAVGAQIPAVFTTVGKPLNGVFNVTICNN